jgi:peptide/nickel transport system ATP-binding protein
MSQARVGLNAVGLQVKNLRVSYGGFVAVADTSFEVQPGESFGIVGESGSGKSTVLRAICGLAPMTGTVKLLGDSGARFAKPGQQGVSPLGANGVSRPLRLAAPAPHGGPHSGRTAGYSRAGAMSRARIERALDEVGLGSGFRFRYPHQLSGGQRQRIAVARALILEPQILLLDEPTSALDASVQAEVLNLLEDLRQKRGLSFIMVSHDLAVVTHLCERLMVMQRGKTVELLRFAGSGGHRVSDPTRRS